MPNDPVEAEKRATATTRSRDSHHTIKSIMQAGNLLAVMSEKLGAALASARLPVGIMIGQLSDTYTPIVDRFLTLTREPKRRQALATHYRDR
jgi:hypothetical protein